ncbi:MAG: hypothetical protein NXH95_07525 [Pseudomonadaceae bacterium]|nr:hypothetical protein [Pseudomonadaceae bacterium]
MRPLHAMRLERNIVSPQQPLPRINKIALISALVISCAAYSASAWEAYGGDAGGSKYSALDQIDHSNVEQLQQAWVYQSGETGAGYANEHGMTFEATPLFWQDTLFFNSSFGKAYAVDATTGEERWRFGAQFDPSERFKRNRSARRQPVAWQPSGAGVQPSCVIRYPARPPACPGCVNR